MDAMAPANPFPGLRPFESEESHLFFGRESQSDELLARLGRHRFLAVVGTSGSGKSSLVRAGLLPSLHGGLMAGGAVSWQVACFRPGNDPIGNLALALAEIPGFVPVGGLEASVTSTLRRSGLGLLAAVREARMPLGQSLLVVVDQFEELFRFQQTVDENRSGDAAAFVKLLLEATAQAEIPIYVVLTMRSDYLGDCAQFRDLPERLNDAQYLIPRMTRDQRREAITGPVLVGGGRIAPRLVNRLLNDVGDNPDHLPILQHALMRMWDLWARQGRGGEIDLEHDEAVRGMATALSRHADEAYEELDPRGREIAESLFRSLTEKGPDNREIRRPARLGELSAIAQASTEEILAVVEAFRREGRSFLMPRADVALQEDTVIDISHESLIRGWQRLKAWVDQEVQSARMYRKVAEDAALHAEGKAALWRDPNLTQALHWREESRPTEAWAERYHPGFQRALSFLDESYQTHLAERARIKRGRVKLRLLEGALAVALVVAAGLAVYVAGQARQTLVESYWLSATHARNESELLKTTYFSGRYLKSGTDESRWRSSTLSAQFGSQDFLVGTLPQAKSSITANHDGALSGKTISPDRRLVLTWELQTALLRSTDGSPPAPRSLEHENMVLGGSFSPDNTKILTWSLDDSVRLWSVDGSPLVPPIRHREAVLGAELSKDGRSILTWSEDGIARLWSAADGALQAELFHGESLVAANLVGNDQAVTWGSSDGARLWNLQGFRHEDRPKARRDGTALPSQISPEGRIPSPDGRYILRWSPETGARLETVGGDVPTVSPLIEPRSNGLVYGGVFSHQGDLLLTWRGDGVIQLWKVPGGAAALPPIKQGQPVTGAVFSRDDSLVLIWDSDCARLWSTVDGTPVTPPMRSEGVMIRASFSPDEAAVVTESTDGTVQRWDIGADYDFPRKDWPLLIEVATGHGRRRERNGETSLPRGVGGQEGRLHQGGCQAPTDVQVPERQSLLEAEAILERTPAGA